MSLDNLLISDRQFGFCVNLLKSRNFRRIDCGILRLKTERDINKEKGEIYFYNARIGIRMPIDL